VSRWTGRGEYDDDLRDRTRYHHDYYTRNKLSKKYTYIKKGVMKRLSASQYAILVKMRTGFVLYCYLGDYRYYENGLYHRVNRASAECLLASGHIALDKDIARLTDKGINHKQSTPKK
jgi:hypothetical protein